MRDYASIIYAMWLKPRRVPVKIVNNSCKQSLYASERCKHL